MGRRTLVLSALAAVAVAGAFALAMAGERHALPPGSERSAIAAPPASSTALPVLFRIPAFSFSDQKGQVTTNGDFRGHVSIADFVFTSCTTICPLITAKMALLQRRLRGVGFRFVSFSVDPARDTPEALEHYATEWRPGETRWRLLATTPKGLEALTSAMFVSVKPVENDIAHSNLFFLVEGEGDVRGIYESDRDDAVERLVRDAEALANATREPSPRDRAATGAELYGSLGCGACHARSELAPPLEGLLGRRVALEGGGELGADAAYVRESIVTPDAKRAAGYVLRMPSYADAVTEGELEALVTHVASFAAPTASAKPKPPAPVASAAPAVVIDPVCSMSVRVVASTPRASHAGKSYYFCSDTCRERFVADPSRYTKPDR